MSDVVCYGRDGPAFDRACPFCQRFMKFPGEMSWKERADGLCEFPQVECKRCGSVKPEHIGWGSDFMAPQ